jgi:hypothetical protein
VATIIGVVLLSVATDRCDPHVHTCDLAVTGGLGLGFLLAPFVGCGFGALLYRRLRRAGIDPPAV